MTMTEKAIREPSMLDALIPLVFMIVMLSLSILLFGIDAFLDSLQVALFLSSVGLFLDIFVISPDLLIPVTELAS